MTEDAFEGEVGRGERFAFGENWRKFLSVLDEERIRGAEASLEELLEVESLEGRSFLDIGSGSGLFSLAAARLGAKRIHSFDFDPESVACTTSVRDRHAPAGVDWTVERGSVLDLDYLRRLGKWDTVYSWGVLHHTGAMWSALGNAGDAVADGGRLVVAIYNDQGPTSKWWHAVKRAYNQGPAGRVVVSGAILPYFILGGAAKDLLKGQSPLTRYTTHRGYRGMSPVHDWMDWLGGLPFEVASPAAIHDFFRARGFELSRLHTVGGRHGCNEFSFVRR